MIVKIQNRRGQYVDFDPSKLLPGEFAIVQTGDPNTSDGKAIYIGVTAGNVKQIATLDELQSEIETALNEALPQAVEEATAEATAEADRAEAAATQLASTVTQVATNTADIAQLDERMGDLSDLETEDKTDIVSAINEAARSGITDEVKAALLACFEKVAWIDTHGQDYYNALESALYTDVDEWTWKWESSSGELLSENDYLTAELPESGYTEEFVNGLLRVTMTSNGVTRYRLNKATNSMGRMAAKVRFHSVPLTNYVYNAAGLRLQLSDSSKGAQVFEGEDLDTSTPYFALMLGNNLTKIQNFSYNEWYVIELEQTSTGQKLSINGQVVYAGEYATMYTTANQIIVQASPMSCDIEWIAYKDLDVIRDWDYEWNASSQTLPQYSRALTYNFVSDPGYMYAENLITDFNYVGDCRLYIKGKVTNNNPNPQFCIRNSLAGADSYNGVKIVPFYNNQNIVGCNANGSIESYQINPANEHEYILEMVNGIASFYCDGELVASGSGVTNNQYLSLTGIYSYDDSGQATTTYTMCSIKEIKFKRL